MDCCVVGVGPGGLTVQERDQSSYEDACRACEIEIEVSTPDIQRALLGKLSYMFNGKKCGGRKLVSDLPSLGLRRGDRLEPDRRCLNPAHFEKRKVPFMCTFWRQHFDCRGKNCDWITHRSPVFDEDRTGMNPIRSLAGDTLHSVFLGPLQRWTAAVLMRVLHCNPWKTNPPSRRLRLLNDLSEWFNLAKIPADRQIGDITDKMLPPYAADPHPGGVLKLKAAETSILARFALHMVRRHENLVTLGTPLRLAGEALQDWLAVISTRRVRLYPSEVQSLVDSAVRHRVLCDRAGVRQQPKHHQIQHMSDRSCGDRRSTGI